MATRMLASSPELTRRPNSRVCANSCALMPLDWTRLLNSVTSCSSWRRSANTFWMRSRPRSDFTPARASASSLSRSLAVSPSLAAAGFWSGFTASEFVASSGFSSPSGLGVSPIESIRAMILARGSAGSSPAEPCSADESAAWSSVVPAGSSPSISSAAGFSSVCRPRLSMALAVPLSVPPSSLPCSPAGLRSRLKRCCMRRFMVLLLVVGG